MRRIYLDYAASTPVDLAVEKAMRPYLGRVFGNPGSLHSFGQEASGAIFSARRRIAEAVGADYKEIVFAGSATEANNLALRGAVKACKSDRPQIITSAIEHESVLETCRDLEKQGIEVVYIPVSRDGIVDVRKLKAALSERTILVSVMYANNEAGTIQPIAEIAKIIRNIKRAAYPLFHTDAVQAFQYLDCDVNKLGVDLLTISAHKIYGPKGIGALYVKNSKFPISPIITGSGQEFGLRSGTENAPYIVGFAKAVEIATKAMKSESGRVEKLRDYFWKILKAKLPELEINGSLTKRLPNNLNIYFSGRNAHELQMKLDLLGVAASPGAACRSGISKVSYTLAEMGFSHKRASGSLRFSLGRQTTKADIDYVVLAIRRALTPHP